MLVKKQYDNEEEGEYSEAREGAHYFQLESNAAGGHQVVDQGFINDVNLECTQLINKLQETSS